MTQDRAVRLLQAALHLRLDDVYSSVPNRIRAAILRRATRQENGAMTLSAIDAAILRVEIGNILDRADDRAAAIVARGLSAAEAIAMSDTPDIIAAWTAARDGQAARQTGVRATVAESRRRAMRQVAAVLDHAAATGRPIEDVATHLGRYADPFFARRRDPGGTIRRATRPGARLSGPAVSGNAALPSRHLVVSEVIEAHGQRSIMRAAQVPGALIQWSLAPWHKDADTCDFYANQDIGYGPGRYPPYAVPKREHVGCICVLSYVNPEEPT